MIRIAALLIFATLPLVSRADEAEDRFVAQMRAAIQEREQQREELESHLKELQAGRVNRRLPQRGVVTEVRGRKRYTWNSPEAKERAIAEVKQKIDRLAGDGALLPALSVSRPAIGDIGSLPEVSEGYEYALSGGESVAIPRHTTYVYRVRQVVDGENALIEQVRHDHQARPSGSSLFWLISPTAGLADGSPLQLSPAYRVTGTRQYETAVGSSKTVFVLEPYDATDLIKKAKQPARQPQ